MFHALRRGLLLLPFAGMLCTASALGKSKPKIDTLFTSDGIEVYIRKNRAKKIRFIGELHLADGESAVMDPGRLCTGLNADVFFKRWVSLNGGIKGAWYSVATNFADEKSRTLNDLKPFMAGSVGVRLHGYDGKGKAWKKVTLGTYNNLDYDGSVRTTVRFLNAKFPCREIFAARAGVYYTNAAVSADMNGKLLQPDAQGKIVTADGTTLSGHYYTNSYTNGMYFGLTRIRNLNIRVSSNIDTFEGKGRHIAFFREVYADVILADTRFDPFIVPGGKQYEVGSGSFRLTTVGWRVGGRALSTRGTGTLGGWYEIGMRPGIYARGLYAAIGFNMSIFKEAR
jgi:hypothetical protein